MELHVHRTPVYQKFKSVFRGDQKAPLTELQHSRIPKVIQKGPKGVHTAKEPKTVHEDPPYRRPNEENHDNLIRAGTPASPTGRETVQALGWRQSKANWSKDRTNTGLAPVPKPSQQCEQGTSCSVPRLKSAAQYPEQSCSLLVLALEWVLVQAKAPGVAGVGGWRAGGRGGVAVRQRGGGARRGAARKVEPVRQRARRRWRWRWWRRRVANRGRLRMLDRLNGARWHVRSRGEG